MRCLFETEDGNFVCLVQYDRAGAAFGQWVDVLYDPETFVKLVLNIASRDVYILGLDPSVRYWRKDGKKTGGTITVNGVEYLIVGVGPMYTECGGELRSRATTCFKLKLENSDEEYVLKTTWRTGQTVFKEREKLEMVKGIAGVVQMIDWDEETTTQELRGNIEDSECVHRVRIIMECTGPSIAHFSSETELVGALLDVVKGR